MPPPVVSTWFYAEREGEESVYPQVGGRSSSTWFQAVYWRCVVDFFATSARVNPGAVHRLYTNVDAVPDVDGLDTGAFLRRLGVETVVLPYVSRPPDGWFPAWANQFYVLDVAAHLAETLPTSDAVGVLLDSDCVWARRPERMAEMTRRHRALTYDLGRPEGVPENGLTPEALGAIHGDLAPAFGAEAPAVAPPYVGGELVAATGDTLRAMDDLFDPLFEAMIARRRDGLPTYNEEAHALGLVYHVLGVPYGTANPYLRRIWTTLLKGDDARPDDLERTVWHVPGEKRYGLRRLFEAVFDEGGPFWGLEGDAWRAWAGRTLGLPGRTLAKTARDVPVALRDKLRERLG